MTNTKKQGIIFGIKFNLVIKKLSFLIYIEYSYNFLHTYSYLLFRSTDIKIKKNLKKVKVIHSRNKVFSVFISQNFFYELLN